LEKYIDMELKGGGESDALWNAEGQTRKAKENSGIKKERKKWGMCVFGQNSYEEGKPKFSPRNRPGKLNGDKVAVERKLERGLSTLQ